MDNLLLGCTVEIHEPLFVKAQTCIVNVIYLKTTFDFNFDLFLGC